MSSSVKAISFQYTVALTVVDFILLLFLLKCIVFPLYVEAGILAKAIDSKLVIVFEDTVSILSERRRSDG